MKTNVNTVKIDANARGYHHGALRQSLIEAAEAVIADRGVDGFSLREAARRAGVSPAAPAHHFGDARGLLTAVAAKAFRDFGDALENAESNAAQGSQVRAQGFAYVRFALANRPKFDLLWRKALIDDSDPEYAAAGHRAFVLLDQAVRGPGVESSGPNDTAIAASIAAWSIVHGFARLAMDGVFGTEDGAAEAAIERLLPEVLDHLDV
jgi:AcrR family transcriptional regulator